MAPASNISASAPSTSAVGEPDEAQEYLADLAEQIAASQAVGLVVQPVTGVAAETTAAAKKVPIVGELLDRASEAYDYTQRLGMRKADEVISSNAASMINSIGVTILNSLHDHAMPQGVHRFVDDAYGHIWPQMKKSLMDSVMLGAGFEFRSHQRAQIERDPEPPEGLLRRAAARLIYAMEPYDLTIWGVIRSPLSLCIQLAFLFPLYGVSDMLILTLAASKYFTNFNGAPSACGIFFLF